MPDAPTGLPQDHGTKVVVDAALALLVGFLSVVQARVNGQLALTVDSGVEAAALSFGTGLIVIAVLVAVIPSGRRAVGRLRRGVRQHIIPKWLLIGGLGGATFVAAQGIAVPTIGVALFTVALVAGLTTNSLVVDRIGLGPGGVRRASAPRIAGALVAVVGVAAAVSGQFDAGVSAAVVIVPMVLTFTAGTLVAAQQAINGRLAQASGSPLAAALVNFIVGFSALAIVSLLWEAGDGVPLILPPAPWEQPVLWLGGPLGVTFVAIAAFTVKGLGVLLFSLLSIVGQLVGGVLIDAFRPIEGAASLNWTTLLAVVLLAAATGLAAFGTRSGRMHG